VVHGEPTPLPSPSNEGDMKAKAKKNGSQISLGILCSTCRNWRVLYFDLSVPIALLLRFVGDTGEWELEIQGFYECNDCHTIGADHGDKEEVSSKLTTEVSEDGGVEDTQDNQDQNGSGDSAEGSEKVRLV